MTTALFIPCYNEENNIFNVLEHCKKYIPKEDIYVLDNGSTDNTVNMSRLAAVNVRCNYCNMGIGGSLCYHLQHIPEEYSSVITMDAGWSHDPEDLPLFLANSKYFTIGRRTNWKAPLKRKLFSKVAKVSLQHKLNIDCDWTSGFRNYPVDSLHLIDDWLVRCKIKHHAFRFAIAAELSKTNNVHSVPITFHSSNKSLTKEALWEALEIYSKL